MKSVNKARLEKELEQALDTFADETNLLFDTYDQTPATKGDLCELSKQVYYALNSFKKSLLDSIS